MINYCQCCNCSFVLLERSEDLGICIDCYDKGERSKICGECQCIIKPNKEVYDEHTSSIFKDYWYCEECWDLILEEEYRDEYGYQF